MNVQTQAWVAVIRHAWTLLVASDVNAITDISWEIKEEYVKVIDWQERRSMRIHDLDVPESLLFRIMGSFWIFKINGWNHCRHGQIQTSLSHFFPDVNECQEAGNLMNNCSENAMCMNFPGSYNCSCNPGYEGDPYSNCTGEWIYTSKGFQVNFLLLKG